MNSGLLALRERKKGKTHQAIQGEALRLFRRQGYEPTSIKQICAAAEISPTTCSRYFAHKEDVVLHDVRDPLAMAAFASQPPELAPIEALRRALHETFAGLSASERAEERERQRVIRSTPDLQARMLANLTGSLGALRASIARRTGRAADDVAVIALAGAILGIGIAVWLCYRPDEGPDYVELFDAALARLEAGLPL
jgi:AcrR family transcriptional regulator